MALFEGYERRMPQLQPVLDKYGFKDFEELKARSEAGDPDFCIFAWEIGALEDGFRMAGLTGRD